MFHCIALFCYFGTFIEWDGIIDGLANRNSSLFLPNKVTSYGILGHLFHHHKWTVFVTFILFICNIPSNSRTKCYSMRCHTIDGSSIQIRIINWKFTRDTFQRLDMFCHTNQSTENRNLHPKLDLTSFKLLHETHINSEVFGNIQR